MHIDSFTYRMSCNGAGWSAAVIVRLYEYGRDLNFWFAITAAGALDHVEGSIKESSYKFSKF